MWFKQTHFTSQQARCLPRAVNLKNGNLASHSNPSIFTHLHTSTLLTGRTNFFSDPFNSDGL